MENLHFTVASSQNGMSANLRKKIRPNGEKFSIFSKIYFYSNE
jgi:hypothetical protein